MKNCFRSLLIIIIFYIPIGLEAQQPQPEKTKQTGIKYPSALQQQNAQDYYQNIFQQEQEKYQYSMMPSFDMDKTSLLERIREINPLEGAIDPQTYIIGPGDLLVINVWSAVPFTSSMTVTPEGTIIIPTVGVLDVAGRSLAELKKQIDKEVRKVYIKGDITTSLIAPRIFAVTVSGMVNNPGTYYASAVQRVDQVIYQANLQSSVVKSELQRFKYSNPQEFKNTFKLKPLEFSLRNIKLVRKNGDTLKVDLVRYYATGSTRHNPYLLDGDCIVVPNLDLFGNSVTIAGAFRLTGTYEYMIGDSLSDIFNITQGPTGFADLHRVDLYRLDSNTGKFYHVPIDYVKISNHEAPDIAIQPQDRVMMREKYPRELPLNVIVSGEVVSPGMYPIKHDSTFLSSILSTAGGFTKYASLADAKVIRSYDVRDRLDLDEESLSLLDVRLNDMNLIDQDYFNIESLLASKLNILSVDFQRLFIQGDSTQDVILYDDDIILVPPIQRVISVMGQIPRPGHQQFVPSKDYEYYIKQAGGATNKAWERKIRIIKAGSKNWIKPDHTTLEPGDTIWIPRTRDKEFAYYFDLVAKTIGVVSSVATLIFLAKNY